MKSILLGAALAVALPSAAFAQEAPKKECCCKDMKDKDCCCCDKKGGDHAGHNEQH